MANCLNSLPLNGGSVVRHDNGGYAFSCKKFPQVSDGLEMMWRCHWKHVWELAKVICYYEVFFPKMVLKEVNTYLYSRSVRELMGLQGLDWYIAALNACQALLDVVGHICFHAGPVNTHTGQVHCLVDPCMASMEVCHDAVSAGWWNYHSFTLGQDISIN